MKYSPALINITDKIESNAEMYSIILLRATSLAVNLNGVRCYLSGRYMLCLSSDDVIDVKSGGYEAVTLHFLPYFYNINLNHRVIGSGMYEKMRALHSYPSFDLFTVRSGDSIGIIPIDDDAYNTAEMAMASIKRHIAESDTDDMWSCRARIDMITLMRIADGAHDFEPKTLGERVVAYIRSNIGGEITREDICRRFHTNRTTLAREIKELTGLTLTQFLLEERLDSSRQDLIFTLATIYDVAVKYGFHDANYYIRAFKKRFGVTPLEYRKAGFDYRISNEEKYHLNGRTNVMTRDEFRSLADAGLGKAVTLLRRETNKEFFYDEVIRQCTALFPQIRRRRGVYERFLVESFDNPDALKAEVLELLYKQINEKNSAGLPNADIFIELGGRDKAVELFNGLYEQAKARLSDIIRECPESEYIAGVALSADDKRYPSEASLFFNSSSALMRLLPTEKTLVRFLSDIADFFEYSDYPLIPTYQNPIFHYMDVYGVHNTLNVLEKVYAVHPFGAKLKELMSGYGTIQSVNDPPAVYTARDYIERAKRNAAKGHPNDAEQALAFANADEQTAAEVARALLDESDLKARNNLIGLFNLDENGKPGFPLDATDIVKRARELRSRGFGMNDPRDYSEFPQLALLLGKTTVKCRAVREFGLEMIKKPGSTPEDIAAAIDLAFGVNYRRDDRIMFSELLLSGESCIFDAASRRLALNLAIGMPFQPTELVERTFDCISSGAQRLNFAKTLADAGALPESLREKCRFDAEPRIRQLAEL